MTHLREEDLVALFERMGFVVRQGYFINDRNGEQEEPHIYVNDREPNHLVSEAGIENRDFVAGFSVGTDRSGMQFPVRQVDDLRRMLDYPVVHIRFNRRHTDQLRAVVTLSTTNADANVAGLAEFVSGDAPVYRDPRFRHARLLFDGERFGDPSSCETSENLVYYVIGSASLLRDDSVRRQIAQDAARSCIGTGGATRPRSGRAIIFDRADRLIGTFVTRRSFFLLRTDDDGEDAEFAFQNFGDVGIEYMKHYCSIGNALSCRRYGTHHYLAGLELASRLLSASLGDGETREWEYVDEFNAAIDRAKHHLTEAQTYYPEIDEDWDERFGILNRLYQ